MNTPLDDLKGDFQTMEMRAAAGFIEWPEDGTEFLLQWRDWAGKWEDFPQPGKLTIDFHRALSTAASFAMKHKGKEFRVAKMVDGKAERVFPYPTYWCTRFYVPGESPTFEQAVAAGMAAAAAIDEREGQEADTSAEYKPLSHAAVIDLWVTLALGFVLGVVVAVNVL